jgi:hypothetical protein
VLIVRDVLDAFATVAGAALTFLAAGISAGADLVIGIVILGAILAPLAWTVNTLMFWIVRAWGWEARDRIVRGIGFAVAASILGLISYSLAQVATDHGVRGVVCTIGALGIVPALAAYYLGAAFLGMFVLFELLDRLMTAIRRTELSETARRRAAFEARSNFQTLVFLAAMTAAGAAYSHSYFFACQNLR